MGADRCCARALGAKESGAQCFCAPPSPASALGGDGRRSPPRSGASVAKESGAQRFYVPSSHVGALGEGQRKSADRRHARALASPSGGGAQCFCAPSSHPRTRAASEGAKKECRSPPRSGDTR